MGLCISCLRPPQAELRLDPQPQLQPQPQPQPQPVQRLPDPDPQPEQPQPLRPLSPSSKNGSLTLRQQLNEISADFVQGLVTLSWSGDDSLSQQTFRDDIDGLIDRMHDGRRHDLQVDAVALNLNFLTDGVLALVNAAAGFDGRQWARGEAMVEILGDKFDEVQQRADLPTAAAATMQVLLGRLVLFRTG